MITSKNALIVFGCLLLPIHGASQNGQGDKLKPPVPGLPTATLSAVAMNPDSIRRLVQLIKTTPPNDFRGLVVIKDSKLVVEEYFHTYWRETIGDIRSAGKGITAILLGIAIDKKLVNSTEQSIYDFFPSPKFVAPAKDGHQEIKIKHLLNMSSGLSADDNDPNAPGNTRNWLTEENWVNFAIALPMSFKPGEKYVYNDVCPMLVGAIIEEASGKKLAEFARENLFTPLGIREFYWYTAPGGRTGPMGNLYISALDFAKIGQLVLNRGHWQGKQIVSAAWIDRIANERVDISKEGPFAKEYGYFWFKTTIPMNRKNYDCLFASGNGGNLVFVVPSENLVVSLTSTAYGPGLGHPRARNIFQFVLGSISTK